MTRNNESVQVTRSIARRTALQVGVRRALRLSTGMLAAGLALCTVPIAFAAPFSAVFPLASLLPANGGNGNRGFVLTGIDGGDLFNGDQSGYSVSAAGDINGDGIDDLIVGARYADPDGN